MDYVPHDWLNNSTSAPNGPVSAARLAEMEAGIVEGITKAEAAGTGGGGLSTGPEVDMTIAPYALTGGDNDTNATANHDKIVAAITSLPATGGVLVFGKGIYRSTSLQETSGKPVTFRGQGEYATTLKLSSASTASGLIRPQSDRFGVEYMTLDGNKAGSPSATGLLNVTTAVVGHRYRRVRFANSPSAGISLQGGSSGHSMIGCTVTGSVAEGILCAADTTEVIGCDVNSNTGTGIKLFNGASDAFIVRNRCTSNGNKGIEVNGCDGATVAHNISRSNSTLGIHNLSSTNTLITGNQCHQNLNNGIDNNLSSGGIITNNRCSFNGSSALEGEGILVYRSHDFTVEGNHCWNNGQGRLDKDGIAVGDDGVTVSYNIRIRNNRCWDDQGTQTQRYGVRIGDTTSHDIRVEGNDLRGNKTGPFSSASTTNIIVRRNDGYVTEAKGTVNMPGGTTTVTVTHGLGVAPAPQDIRITILNLTTNNVTFYISGTPNSTAFTLNARSDPGTSGASLAWHAEVGV